jgi:beta-N-acetylhexosaminidase
VKFLVNLVLLISILTGLFSPVGKVEAGKNYQTTPEQEKALLLLAKMTAEEKVGQLFLVNYQGMDTSSESNISKLIEEQHIGGVILRADNDNFSITEALPAATQNMIQELQVLAWRSSIPGIKSSSGSLQSGSSYIPLFVGVSQEGDLGPYDQIINGLTPIPSAMAIGATWKPANAELVGSVLGTELSAMGFNLLLGPSLDVLDLVRTDIGDDLGVRTFGGDPFWVGEMGKAFIKGVHAGSNNKILVISKHFPGRGGSDRLPEDEVATVRKSLEQLKQIELSPFFAVTQGTENTQERTDGLLISHIRYQGFQGNIRATTRPVSFDATALDQLLALDQLSGWRQQGGLIVSDDLGSPAVSKFFAPTGTDFDARQVVRTALLAGNDLLYLGDILSSGDDSSYTTIKNIYNYFLQKYNEDPVFQQRVDEAVLRILTLKYKLYPLFSLNSVNAPESNLESIGGSRQVTFDIARQAVSLVSPTAQELNADLPNPPQSGEKFVIISNVIPQLQCSTCADQSIFLAAQLKDAILRLYGPGAGELVQENQVSAYSFANLQGLLDGVNNVDNFYANLDAADWIVIAFTELKTNSAESLLFQRLFSEKPDLTRNKRVVGFAFNAPYYPDATDISKFTAYYAVYSKTPEFIEIAARVLFRELKPIGILPVSVSSIGYDLITATTPDPNQVIPLMVVSNSEAQSEIDSAATSLGQPLIINAGDIIYIQTGVIRDHNRNPVPDGTVARFIIDSQSSSGLVEQMEAQTEEGVARTNFRIPESGLIELSVTADPATVSQILRIEITGTGGKVTSIDPTFSPTGSNEEPTQASTSTTNNPIVGEEIASRHERGFPDILDWILSSILVSLIVSAVYTYGKTRRKKFWNPWLPFATGIGGFSGYLLSLIGLGFITSRIQQNGTFFILVMVIIGCVLGVGIAYLVRILKRMEKVV